MKRSHLISCSWFRSRAEARAAAHALALAACVFAAGCEPSEEESSDAGVSTVVTAPGAGAGGSGTSGVAPSPSPLGGVATTPATGLIAGGGATATTGGSAGQGTPANPGAPSGAGSGWCQVKPVFDKYCVSCHDGQGTGGSPMGLTTFTDLSAVSKQYPGSKIFERVGVRMHATQNKMPPQGTVSPADLKLVDDWIARGAPGADAASCATASTGGMAGGATGGADEPWPADCEKRYKILAHDTADATKPYRMAPGVEAHPGFTFDAPWGSDPVQGIAFRPVTDNKKVLHHWILYQNSGTRAFLTGWAPGQDKSERKMRDDVGMYLPSGAKSLYLDMHYYNLGSGAKEELDSSGVEVCVVSKAKFRPNTATVFMGFVGIGFPMVPANSTNYNLTANCTVNASSPVHLLTASPHAHKLATHMKFTAKAGGQDIVMHDAPFDFNEQTSHPLSPEVVLNTGDTVTTVCTYTNPTNKAINFSENTDGEMCFNFAVYYPMGALSCGGGGGIGGLLGL
jgi:Copper type II ascorbate-dependent monooxygenase, C-terminal domain